MRTVNTPEEARAALRAGEFQLCSPPFAACHAGVNYYRYWLDGLRAEFPQTNFTFTLCCGDDAAMAHDALRLGFTQVRCDCGAPQLAQLRAMAAVLGTEIRNASL